MSKNRNILAHLTKEQKARLADKLAEFLYEQEKLRKKYEELSKI